MTNSGTNLVGFGQNEEFKTVSNKALNNLQQKKTLQNTNSTNLFETVTNSTNHAINTSVNK
jgi:hypothetical protein